MELLFLFVPIIYVLFFILSCKENKYLKKHEEDEDNVCAPTDFNPANGAPMIGCLDIYGNPYGVSGAIFSKFVRYNLFRYLWKSLWCKWS